MGNDNKKPKDEGHRLGSDPALAAKQKARADGKRPPEERPPPKVAPKKAPQFGGGGSGHTLAGGGSGTGPPKPERVVSSGSRSMSKSAQAEAARRDAKEQRDAQIKYGQQQVQGGLSKLARLDEETRLKALNMLDTLLGNVNNHPTETKFQKIRTTNAKIAEVVVKLDGAADILMGAGFQTEGEFMIFSDAHDKSRHALKSAIDKVKNAVYDIKGRPKAEGELGGQGHVGGRWISGRMGDDEELAAEVAAAGGICAEKHAIDDPDDDGDHVTIEQVNEVENAVEFMSDSNTRDSFIAAMELIHGVMENIVRNPEQEELRCIPDDASLRAKTESVEGALHLLEASGFKAMQMDGESLYVCSLGPRSARNICDRLEVVLKQARTKASVDEAIAASAPEVVERELQVLRVTGSSNPADIPIPEHYFQIRKGDLAALSSAGAPDRQLTTENMRQKQDLERRKKYNRTVIRVQFPDGLLLQMAFSPRERVNALIQAVAECLNEPTRPFALSLGSQLLDQPTRSIWDAHLVPSALLHFRWAVASGADDLSSIVKDEHLCAVQFLG